MKKIYSIEIDLSEMPTEEITRSFTVVGERDSEFIMYIVEDGTIKYYDFVDEAFELGHNSKDNNLKVTLSGNSYSGNIKFPFGIPSNKRKKISSYDQKKYSNSLYLRFEVKDKPGGKKGRGRPLSRKCFSRRCSNCQTCEYDSSGIN